MTAGAVDLERLVRESVGEVPTMRGRPRLIRAVVTDAVGAVRSVAGVGLWEVNAAGRVIEAVRVPVLGAGVSWLEPRVPASAAAGLVEVGLLCEVGTCVAAAGGSPVGRARVLDHIARGVYHAITVDAVGGDPAAERAWAAAITDASAAYVEAAFARGAADR